MRRLDRRGFALPFTIFMIAIVTLLLTAAFTKVQADRRIADSSGANVAALAVARSVLHQYMGTKTVRPPDGDSVRINVVGGYGDVVATVIRRPADTLANWLYVLRATAHVIDATQGADPTAVRTLAQFAQWQTGRMDVLAAYTAANNVSINTTSGANVTIYGHDYCGVSPSKAGAYLRSSGGGNDIPSGEGYFGTSAYWTTYGSPVRVEAGTALEVATATNVDWQALTGGGFTPDYTSIQFGSGAYASQYVGGNATISNNWGSGLLIVTGDLFLTGSWAQWYGIILVGGRVYFDASSYSWVQGSLTSGLNYMLGSNPSSTVIGNRTIYLYYDSCLVRQSLLPLTGFAPITNGWVDNWAQY